MNQDKQLGLFGLVVTLLLMVPSALYSGWVLALLWRWFIVPLGVHPIGVMHVWGIMTMVQLATHQYSPKSVRDDDREGFDFSDSLRLFREGITLATTALVCGWIAHLCM